MDVKDFSSSGTDERYNDSSSSPHMRETASRRISETACNTVYLVTRIYSSRQLAILQKVSGTRKEGKF